MRSHRPIFPCESTGQNYEGRPPVRVRQEFEPRHVECVFPLRTARPVRPLGRETVDRTDAFNLFQVHFIAQAKEHGNDREGTTRRLLRGSI